MKYYLSLLQQTNKAMTTELVCQKAFNARGQIEALFLINEGDVVSLETLGTSDLYVKVDTVNGQKVERIWASLGFFYEILRTKT